jgi:DNA (cytosine-5)-methyltransferase 1
MFTGYGGLDTAVETVTGARTVWHSEIDPHATALLKYHFPTVPNLGDIRFIGHDPTAWEAGLAAEKAVERLTRKQDQATHTIDHPDDHTPDKVAAAHRTIERCERLLTTARLVIKQTPPHPVPDWSQVPPVDILTGGFPCQDVSSAGLRAGIAPGTRSGLWNLMAQAINALRPPLVIIENVEGLLSAPAHSPVEQCPWCVGNLPGGGGHVLRALGAVLGDLTDLGYDARWATVAASDTGAPHRRRRVFIVARPADTDGPGWEGQGDQPPGWGTVPHRGGPDHARPPDRPDAGPAPQSVTPLFATPRSTANRTSRGAAVSAMSLSSPSLEQCVELAEGVTPREFTHTGLPPGWAKLLPTPRATDGTHGGPNQRGSSGDLMLPSAVHVDRFGAYAGAVARWEPIIGREAPEPRLPTGQLNPRFVEWMMGLPVGWVCDVPGIPWSARLRLLGNGVVPQQAVAALRHLL